MKVFGIGFHKTGTKSLGQALALLGYRVAGPVRMEEPVSLRAIEQRCLPLLDNFDAVQDNPWPFLFRSLDRLHPGAKFILTVRDREAWIDSVVSHFGTAATPMRRWIYGAASPVGREAAYVKSYLRHNAEVMDYFSRRPGTLLVWDLTLAPDWKPLCDFLGKPLPALPFPHVNARANRLDGTFARADRRPAAGKPGIFPEQPEH